VLRSLTLALLALSILASTAAAHAAPEKVYVESDIVSQELSVRPHAIELSADGTFALTGLRYQSYGGPAATANGRAYVRGCTPNCAEGKVYRPATTARLSGQIQCRGLTIYSRLHYSLKGPLPPEFRRQGTEPLRPVGPEGC
jgi:hypothetical protein